MISKEQSAESVSMPKSGFFALLSGSFRAKGSGASKHGRGSGAQRWRRGVVFVPFLAFCLACFAPSAALAKTTHFYTSSFGSEGSGNGQFKEPAGVAVNEVALGDVGDVYVVDKGNDRVERFAFNSSANVYEYASQFNGAPSHALSSPEGIAVDNSLSALDSSKGDVYVVDTGHDVVDRFGASGVYEGQLTGTCAKAGESPPACAGFVAFSGLHGVTVDGEGDVWVYETEAVAQEGEIAEFSDTGAFVDARGTGHGAKSGVALDSSGHVFVVFGSGDVGEFEASTGTQLAKTENEDATGLATSPSSGRLFIDTGSQIEERGLTEPLSEPEKTFPAEGLSGSEGIAASATGTVYAVQRGRGSVEVFDEDTLPEVSTQTPSNLTPHTVTLNGTVNPEGVEVTSCEFEYGTTTAYGSTAACSPSPGSGNTPVAVSANIAGLSPATVYHCRLVVGNSEHVTEASTDETFLTRGAGISEEQVTGVGQTEVTLEAKIDPNESPTTYHFEYDMSPYTSSAAHGTTLPVPDASIGAGTSPVPVSAQLNGLQPGSTYYYRVVAVSELEPGIFETFDGPGKTFTTNALPAATAESCPNAKARAEQAYGPTLPDCRAYEMVSPLAKGDSGIAYVQSRAAVSGEALTYLAPGSFQNPKSALLESRYLSRRTAAGWSTENISPPYSDYETNALTPAFDELLFTSDLSRGVLESVTTPLVAGEPVGYINLYVADNEDGSYQTVSNVTPEKEIAPFTEKESPIRPQAEGASNDFSRVVFQQAASLTEGASPHQEHIYEWVDGVLHLVDVAPAGGKLEGEDNVGAAADFDEPQVEGNAWHAVSTDGQRIFFTGGEKREVGQLFVRENPAGGVEGCGVVGDACTVEVSASQRTDCNVQRKALEPGYVCTGMPEPDPHGPQFAYFRDASADGSRVFFVSKAELTDDANTGAADDAGNLYEYDVNTGILTDLTADGNPNDENGAEVLGLVTAGEDGSYVYFVANGVLASGASKGNCQLEESEAPVVGGRTCALYVVHRGESGWETPRFIAMLAGGNVRNYTANQPGVGDEEDWIGRELTDYDFGPGRHSVRVSGDGTRLVFESELSLTGFDNEQAEPGKCEPAGRCREVYLYDVETGKLTCVSCDPSGARPAGPAELGGDESEPGNVAAEPSSYYRSRNLSENGARLFFQSPDALVPQDSNGKLDVYEWEQPATAAEMEKGENSCTASSPDFHASEEGCVLPISDVAGNYESHFMDASANGNNVFIATADQLVPSDTDSRVDAYDVRVGGGFPVSTPPPTCGNADSCKTPVSSQPGVFSPSGSATFNGLGNFPPSPPAVKAKPKSKATKCGKGEVRKRNKCLKKPKGKKAKKVKRAGRDRRVGR